MLLELVRGSPGDLQSYPTTPFPWACSLQQVPSDVRMGNLMCQHLALLEQVRRVGHEQLAQGLHVPHICDSGSGVACLVRVRKARGEVASA